MRRGPLTSGFVLAIGIGLYSVTTPWSDRTIEPSTDPEETVAAVIDLLERSRDTDRAIDEIYSAIASEALTRSGRVNSLHLQSAALRLGRGEVDTALTYLNLALGFDTHAPMHDPQAFGVPLNGAPFMPAWPLTLAAGALTMTIGAWLFGRLMPTRSLRR